MQTQSQTKSSGIKLPEVHGIKKILDTNTLPGKQKTVPQVKKSIEIKLRIKQGRAGLKCKKPHIMKNICALADKWQGMPKIPATQNIAKNRMDFPMHKQSISSSKTEAIT